MTKKIHERVLLDSGMFGPFPEKLIEKAVEREERQPVDEVIEEPQLVHGIKGKQELKNKKAKKK